MATCALANDPELAELVTKPEHAPGVSEAAAAEIPPIKYIPPEDRWQNLRLTRCALTGERTQLHVVMLGDSIVNDTFRSEWASEFQRLNPKCEITVTAVVRGSTGAWWYRDEDRISRFVLPLEPDLLIIGGISHRDDTEAIREVIKQVRAARDCDVLLMTGAFGGIDPTDPKKWSFEIPEGSYRSRLRDLAKETRAGFLDMTAHWGATVLASDHPLEWFKRDQTHANARGEQVLGGILLRHLHL